MKTSTFICIALNFACVPNTSSSIFSINPQKLDIFSQCSTIGYTIHADQGEEFTMIGIQNKELFVFVNQTIGRIYDLKSGEQKEYELSHDNNPITNAYALPNYPCYITRSFNRLRAWNLSDRSQIGKDIIHDDASIWYAEITKRSITLFDNSNK